MSVIPANEGVAKGSKFKFCTSTTRMKREVRFTGSPFCDTLIRRNDELQSVPFVI